MQLFGNILEEKITPLCLFPTAFGVFAGLTEAIDMFIPIAVVILHGN